MFTRGCRLLYLLNGVHHNLASVVPVAATIASLRIANGTQRRFYAKGDRGNVEKKAAKASTGGLSTEQLQALVNLDELEQKFTEQLDRLKQEFLKHLSLRTNIQSFETLPVVLPDSEAPVPLNHLGRITLKSPALAVINLTGATHAITAAPFLLKCQLGVGLEIAQPIMDAIAKSGLNVNPQQDGTSIFLPIPKVTREHRQTLAKNAKQLCQQYKNQIRNIQEKHRRSLMKKEGISADNSFHANNYLEARSKHYMQLGDELLVKKQEELLQEN